MRVCKFFLKRRVPWRVPIRGPLAILEDFTRTGGGSLASVRARSEWIAVGLLFLGVSAWLWPIGFGGKMPVGGDVTQFSLGPMSFLSRALRAGRLPFWDELWGYGFPGVGESQMGVFYPPHWLLYGVLSTEYAYTASLVLHTLWGGLGAYYCCRRFGASAVGSALGGLGWSCCGFFGIHVPHQWAYTTGCWMPWAWGLAWAVLREPEDRRAPFLLVLALAMQILPGHFQLAFCTQVGVVLLAVSHLELSWRHNRGLWGRALVCAAALGGAMVLAAGQLVPTHRLAGLAATRRDFEYLSGFAASPLHLVSFVAPGLFGRSPLWRPLVWDPFHTSPEEYLGYVGVVPLWLAFGAVRRGWTSSPGVRALALVGLATLLLSVGPYLPGYRAWSLLPGFSFFRAPARWLLATSLALSALAALGYDGLPTWPRAGRLLRRFTAFGLTWTALAVLLVEGAVAATATPGSPSVARLYERAVAALPWRETSSFSRLVRAARSPNLDFRVQEAWARQGVRLDVAPRPVFVGQRLAIYCQELGPTVLIFGALVVLAPFAGSRSFRATLIVLTVLDLGLVGRQRRLDVGPVARLVDQSSVLAALARLPGGSRTVDSLRNMPMVAGANPVSAYRTLDLPALDSLTSLAAQVPRRPGDVEAIVASARTTGAVVRVFDPLERRELLSRGVVWPAEATDVRDSAAAGWKFGNDWVAQQETWASTFRIASMGETPPRAWLVPLTAGRAAAILGEWSGNPKDVIQALNGARPLTLVRRGPERRDIRLTATDSDSVAVISELADPQWQAVWTRRESDVPDARRVGVERAFGRPNQGAWQAVRVPGAGEWTLTLVYDGRDVRQGLLVSGAGLVAFAGLFMRYGRRRAPGEGGGA